MTLSRSRVEKGLQGWLIRGDQESERREGRDDFAFSTDPVHVSYALQDDRLFEERKKEQKRKKNKEWWKAWAFLGALASPSLDKKQVIFLKILSRQWGPPHLYNPGHEHEAYQQPAK